MNRIDFISLIEGSGPENRNVLGELSSLVNVFPYFHSAYMLLLKGLQNTADVKFENQLRSSALRIANREVLYYYLKKETVPVHDSVEAKPSGISKDRDKVDTEQVVIELAKNSEEFISEIEKDENSDKSDSRLRGYSIIITAESGDKETDASLIVINEESGEIEEKVVYMDPGFSVSEKPDLLELDTENDNFTESDKQDGPQISGKEEEIVSKRQLQADLIDRFIIANPRIESVREQNDLPLTDISTPFPEEKEGFLTETLARIFIKQGYYSKAINIYERLSLKYPEKSSYFASLILEVKEHIKK